MLYEAHSSDLNKALEDENESEEEPEDVQHLVSRCFSVAVRVIEDREAQRVQEDDNNNEVIEPPTRALICAPYRHSVSHTSFLLKPESEGTQ